MSYQSERRSLQFKNLNEVFAEVERLASGQVRTTGNHTFGQIINHLAMTHDISTGRITPPPMPWYMR